MIHDITVCHNNDGSYPGRYVGISAQSWHMSGSAGGNIYAGNITRQAFSMMVVNYLEKVVWVKQVISSSCSFPIVSSIVYKFTTLKSSLKKSSSLIVT